MRGSGKRAGLRQLLTAGASAGLAGGFSLLVGGCENPTAQADKTVAHQVEDARAKDAQSQGPKSRGNTPTSRPGLIAALDKAAGVANASPGARSDVRLEEARYEVDAGDALSREVASDEIEAARLVGQVQQLQAQIATNNALIEGLRKRDPKDLLKGVDDVAAAAKGSGDSTWGPKEADGKNGPQVPSAAAVDARIVKLEADIKKLTEERDRLDAQQKHDTEEANQHQAKSEPGHGKAALDAGLKAAQLRKQARDATTRIEQIDREITVRGKDQNGENADVPARAGELQILKDQLDQAKAQKAALAAADKSFQDRKAQIDADWAGIKSKIEAYQDLSKRLLEGKEGGIGAGGVSSAGSAGGADTAATAAPTAAAGRNGTGAGPTGRSFDKDHPPTEADVTAATRDVSIKALCEQIRTRLADADVKRQQALDNYNKAVEHVKDAQKLAQQVVTQVSKRENDNPQSNSREAWASLKDLFNTNDFNLELASIQTKIAHLQSDAADGEALVARLHADLEKVLKDAGLSVPDSLPNPADKANEDRAAAKKAFDDAEDILETVATKGGGSPVAKADALLARQMRAAERYARAQFALHSGDATAAQNLVNDAKRDLMELQNENALPPDLYLSPELAAAVGRGPKPAGTTQPTFPTTPGTPGTTGTPAPFPTGSPAGTPPTGAPTPATPTTPTEIAPPPPAPPPTEPAAGTPSGTTPAPTGTTPAPTGTPAESPTGGTPATTAPAAEAPGAETRGTGAPPAGNPAPPPAGGPRSILRRAPNAPTR